MQALPVIRAIFSTLVKAPTATCTRRLLCVSITRLTEQKIPLKGLPSPRKSPVLVVSPDSSISLPRADTEDFAGESKLRRQQRRRDLISGKLPTPAPEAPQPVYSAPAGQSRWEWTPLTAARLETDTSGDIVDLHESETVPIQVPKLRTKTSVAKDFATITGSGLSNSSSDEKQNILKTSARSSAPEQSDINTETDAETGGDLDNSSILRQTPLPVRRTWVSLKELQQDSVHISATESPSKAELEPEAEIRTRFASDKPLDTDPPAFQPYYSAPRIRLGKIDEGSAARRLVADTLIQDTPFGSGSEESDKMSVNTKRIANPVLLICDVQDKFRSAIWEFEKVYASCRY